MSELGSGATKTDIWLDKQLADRRTRRATDVARLKELNPNECQLCGAHGEDKRWLKAQYLYDLKEYVPELIETEDNFLLQTCKNCRGDFLVMLRSWADYCKARRGLPMDADGHLDADGPSADHPIPIRDAGRIKYIAYEEWERVNPGVEPYTLRSEQGASHDGH